MPTQLDKSARGVRYLLGELSQEEEQTFEKSFFADDEVFQDLEITETEVIDAYVANEIEDRQRKHFEEILAASPRLQERVAFARAFEESAGARNLLHEKTISPREGKDPWWRKLVPFPLGPAGAPAWALAASAIVLLAIGVVVVQSVRLRNESQRLAAQRTELARQRDELARLSVEESNRTATELREVQARAQRLEELVRVLQQPPEEKPPGTPTLASIILTPGSLRGSGDVKELPLARGVSEVRLQLALPAVDYPKYRVTITGPGGEIPTRIVRPTRSKTIVLRLPASLFPPGQYTVDVSGVTPTGDVEPVSNYTFRVQN